jgi:hypothetical protein
MKRAIELILAGAVIAAAVAFYVWIASLCCTASLNAALGLAGGLVGMVIEAGVAVYHDLASIPAYVPLIIVAAVLIMRELERVEKHLQRRNNELLKKLESIEQRLLWLNK